MADDPALVALTRAEIAAAEVRCAQATPGPWIAQDHEDGRIVYTTRSFVPGMGYCGVVAECGGIEDADKPDSDFIVAARVDLPRALVGNAAFLALVERIEHTIREIEIGIAAGDEIHSDALSRLDELRALLSPPKEPTR